MRRNTPRRFSAMLLVVVVTNSFQPTVSLKTQRCVRGGCKLTCPKSPAYNSCKQICTGGSCNLVCLAAEKCDFSCTGGSCKPILCTARTCDLSCTGGGCEMDCKGEHCKASCTGGGCTLKCPSNSKTCKLRCTVGPCKTIRQPSTALTTVPPTSPQPTSPRNPRNPLQTCSRPQGGCRLTCPSRPNYSSCVQNCNGGKGSFSLK